MTKWEAGECLIAAADALGEQEQDLRAGGFADLADVLWLARMQIGKEFNALGSHDFGLPSHDEAAELKAMGVRVTASVVVARGPYDGFSDRDWEVHTVREGRDEHGYAFYEQTCVARPFPRKEDAEQYARHLRKAMRGE